MTDNNEIHDAPCQCVLCTMARMGNGPDVGPKEPRDDDSDDDSDDAAAGDVELCDCKQCRPDPIPVGAMLIRSIQDGIEAMLINYDEAGEFGSKLTTGLAARPMPPDVEAVLLQYAADNWNAADRATVALCGVLAKYDPTRSLDALPKNEPKTLDDAIAMLAHKRANRPRRKGHDMKSRVGRFVESLFGGGVTVAVVKVKP